MQVIPAVAITPAGGFTRASTGTYFDRAGVMQTAIADAKRYDHDPVTGEAKGLLIETAATNLVLNSATLVTQDVVVIAQAYTLSFYGTGTVTLSGAATGTLVGTAAYPAARVTLTVTPALPGTLTLTVSGTVQCAQLEAGSLASSYIATVGAAVTRAAEVITATFITNVPEPVSTAGVGTNDDPLAWNSATVYAIGDLVYLASTHRRYQARTATSNKNPALATVTVPSTDWTDAGPTNAYSAIDLLRSTAVRYADEIVQVFKPGVRFDSIGLAGVLGKKVTVKQYHDNVLVYQATATMIYRNTLTWYEYVHGAFIYRKVFARFDLLPYTNSIVQVIVERGGAEAQLGAAVIGMVEYLGEIQFDAEDDALNFSKINRIFGGDAQLVQSRSVPRTIQAIYLEKTRVNRARQVRIDLNAVVAFWSGLDDDTHGYYEALAILGIYRKFRINLKHEEMAVLSLELEEV